jgi:hypothetical protein
VAVRVLCLGVPCLVSPSFSAVRRLRAEFQVRPVRRCVRASAGRCIPRGSRQLERVRWAWVRRFRLPEPRGRAAVREGQRDGLVNATFRAA